MRVVSARGRSLILTGLLLLVLPLSWYCGKTGSEAETKRVASPSTGATYKALRTVDVTVRGAGEVEIDGVVARLGNLREALEKSAGTKKEDVVIVLRCKPDVLMDEIKAVHATLVGADLRKVIYHDDADKELPLILPSQEMQDRLSQIPAKDVAVLMVAANGDMILDGQPVSITAVTESIAQGLSANPNLIVSLQTVGSSHYGDFVRALDLAKVAGATRISVD
jgi:biopolymer transport protein ExbD